MTDDVPLITEREAAAAFKIVDAVNGVCARALARYEDDLRRRNVGPIEIEAALATYEHDLCQWSKGAINEMWSMVLRGARPPQ